MLNAPAQFPAPASQQRVSAAAGRKKVQLKPGRSLMDWIRLTKSGKDMTGLRGRYIEVTEEELAKHNKKTDCWMCIRGMVYNVTPYLEYHPGGEEELMRGAGADGTELFDQIHSWVNSESMLKECLVGRMTSKPTSVAKVSEKKSGLKVPKQTLLNGTSIPDGFEKQSKYISLKHEWFQTEDTITVVIYTKQKDINSDSVIVDLKGGVLRAEVRQQEYSYILHLELSHEVQEVVSVRCASKVGKIELNLKKLTSTIWNDLGQPREHHNSCKVNTDGGDCVSMSGPQGNFKYSQLKGISELILLAAGTGFTPMIKLISFTLKMSSFRRVRLMFFNKEEKDILWRDQLDQLSSKDKRFEVEYILSQPHPEWAGKRGRIEMSLCSEFLTVRTEELKTLVCVCGPTSFTEQAVGFFKQLGFSSEEIHAFSG
uniref:cytochrome b5 reductase 4 isoform X3 n=1 Tax=Pristiophorus japonicus TaxID=55135 RepID=UPI00398E8564